MKMPKIIKMLVAGAGIAGIVFPVFYLTLNYNRQKALNIQLNKVLDETLQEKERFQRYTSEIEEKIKEQENKIKELSDVERIQNSLQNAQQSILELNKKLLEINKERLTLQNTNVSLNARLENTNKELLRALDELKLSKAELTKLDTTHLDILKKKVEDLSKEGDFKNQQIYKLKEELTKLKSGQPLSFQKANKEQQGIINNLTSKNREFKQKISDLENQLNLARDEVKRLNATKASSDSEDSAFYESMRLQVLRLSELLVKKELEIDSAREESGKAKVKLAGLETKLASLEQELSINKTDKEKVRDLEGEKNSLARRLNELEKTVSTKSDLVDSLQKKLEVLTGQLAKKQEEIELLKVNYVKAEVTNKEELEKQRVRYEETSLLYNNLKRQVAEFSDALTQKELALEQRHREAETLKEESASLKSHSENLQKELIEAKERQKKAFDDLVAAIKWNKVLQEKIIEISPVQESLGPISKEQQKADELKRKIEVILEPE